MRCKRLTLSPATRAAPCGMPIAVIVQRRARLLVLLAPQEAHGMTKESLRKQILELAETLRRPAHHKDPPAPPRT